MNNTFIIQLVLSVVCGGLIGIERELKKKSAGFRTYILVCLGGCLAEVLSERICLLSASGDPTRIAAGVVGGIGFLGAGVILLDKGHIIGITTAAGLWCTAIIGMLIGFNLYFESIISSVLIVIVDYIFALFIYRERNKKKVKKNAKSNR